MKFNIRSAPLLCILAFSVSSVYAQGPRLALLQPLNGSVELRLVNPVDKSAFSLYSNPTAPSVVVWRTDRPEAWAVGKQGIHQLRYQSKPAETNTVGEAPPVGVTPIDGWLGKDGNQLQVVATTGKGKTLQCALYEPSKEGRWRKLDKPAAKSATGDEDCSSFMSKLRPATGSVSTAFLMARGQCATAGSICDAQDDPKHEQAGKALLKADKNFETAAFADPGATPYYLGFGTMMGDTPHLAAPAFVVKRADGQLQQPALKTPPYLQVTMLGNLALVAGELEGVDPQVVDLKTGHVIYSAKGATAAVWLPLQP
ncbi:hypothetical protein [Undibacterium sp. TC9W]|uniref:hypothetical protein n=1 Tax=Undibacterium sp. TC9W TaxID=3413053 RepID=UPI003BF087E8